MKSIKFFNEVHTPDIALLGGKAANLCMLTANGFSVPGGFCLTTEAYKNFVSFNHLQDAIMRVIASTDSNDMDALEQASTKIRSLFMSGTMPAETAEELDAAYGLLGDGSDGKPCPVAVRSSATAEDLPDMSFAGQQDTYLNVSGPPSLMEAVVKCWGSLWTARAIGYRMKNNIGQDDVALAVAVQLMINSDVSGVMFTANPLTGKRTETAIDAAFGLGEAIVSGQVQPDHYLFDQLSGTILTKRIGDKKTSIRSNQDGGVCACDEENPEMQALTDFQIRELAETGRRIADLYKAPQDIEWAFYKDRLYILQSRSITSLYPMPEGKNAPLMIGKPSVYFSFASWQVMLDPLTPLGRDFFYGVAAAVANGLGFDADLTSQTALVTAGERLYVNISPLIRNKAGRKFVNLFLSSLDEDAASVVAKLSEIPEFGVQKSRMPLKRTIGILSVPVRMFSGALRILINPEKGKKRYEQRVLKIIAGLREKCDSISTPREFTDIMLAFLSTSGQTLLMTLPTCVMAGQIPLQLLARLASGLPGGMERVYELTRGLPNNPTTEMDLALWDVAKSIRCSEEPRKLFKELEASALSDPYFEGTLPSGAQSVIADFLRIYGMRGVAEIDIGRSRWSDDPTPIMQVIKSYMDIEGEDQAPDNVFSKSAKKAEEAGRTLIDDMKKITRNPIKIALIRFMIRRIRVLVGLREMPKFFIVSMLKPMREALLRIGSGMAAQDLLDKPEDIFFLHLFELKENAGNLKELIMSRKSRYAFEKRRKSIPKIILNDGTAFYEGSGSAGDTCEEGSISGNPVSAGTVEGLVRVVFDPHETRVLPGEILVCRATDPAWTPLFLVAAGLVTEIGGMMTHGSVIAREYGIPAVVGVSKATSLLQTGQKIRVNGNTGRIDVLE